MRTSLLLAFLGLSTLLFVASCGDSFSTVLDVEPPEFEPQMTFSTFIDNEEPFVGFFAGRNRDIFVGGDFDEFELDDVSITVTNHSTDEILIGQELDTTGFVGFTYNYFALDTGFFTPGAEYTFLLEHADFPESETRLQFPPVSDNLENLSYKQIDGINLEGNENSSITFEIVDDPNNADFYELELMTLDGFNTFGTFWIESTDPSALKGFPEDNLLFSDQSFNGERKRITVNFDRFNYDPEVNEALIVRWKTLSSSAYSYSLSARRFVNTLDTPFLSPVQIHSNVNDAIGIISFKGITEYVIN